MHVSVCMCVHVFMCMCMWPTSGHLPRHWPNGDVLLRRARAEEGDVVTKHLEHRQNCRNADLKASKVEAEIRSARAARRSRRRAPLEDLVGPQKIFSLTTRRTRELVRSFVLIAIDADALVRR